METSCVSDETRYKCKFCDKFFISPEMLEEHTICHKEKLHSCDICSKVFENSHELGKHYAVHTNDGLFFCSVCNAGFVQESELKNHKDKKHKRAPYIKKVYRCNICEKKFPSPTRLDHHYSFHIGGKPFMCKVCNVSFALNSHFEKHNQVEHPPFSDETNRNWKSYACNYCSLTFVAKISLNLHVATHKHERTYGCTECSASFSQELDLEVHCVQHIKEYYHTFEVMASFGCSICNKFFPLISDLKDHKLSHSDSIWFTPLTFSNELIDSILSDTSKSEADFILNSDVNTLENNPSRADPIVNPIVSSELVMMQENNQKGADSDMTNKSSTETFYIITENEDGTFESNVLEGNCVDFINDDSQIQNIAYDVELSASQISTNHQFLKTSEIPEDSHLIGRIGASDIENGSIATTIPSSAVMDVEMVAAENIEVLARNSKVPRVQYVQSNRITDTGTGKSSQFNSKSETCTAIAYILSDTANDTLGHVAETSTSNDSPPLKSKKMYTCNVCQESFTKSHSLRIHSNIHNGEKPFSCDVCKKAFRHESTLILHQSNHKPLESFVCGECGKSFLTQHNLKAHSSFRHSKQYTCDICGVKFKTKTTLKFHQYTHTTFRPFRCEICNKGFVRKRWFEIHQKFHNGEPLPYTCTDCGEGFVSELYLRRHEFQHSGVKPYPCDLCPKTFSAKTSMERHFLEKHTNEGQYRCNVCGKPFHILEDCLKHMQTHTREYECKACGLKFPTERSLKFHHVRHTNKDPYSCDVCKIRFKLIRDLKNHKEKIHQTIGLQ